MAKVKDLLQANKLQDFVSNGLKDLLGKDADATFVDKLVKEFEELDSKNPLPSEDTVIKELSELVKKDLLKLKNAKNVNEITQILSSSTILKNLDDSNETIAKAIHANNQANIKKQANDQFNELIKIADYKKILEDNKNAVLAKLPLSKMALLFRKAELESNDFTNVNNAIGKLGIIVDGKIGFEIFTNSLKEHTEISTIISKEQVFEAIISTSVSTNNNSNSPNYPTNFQTVINQLKSPKEQTIKDCLANTFSLNNISISDKLIAENRYFYLIKKADDGHPHLKNLLKITPTVQNQLKNPIIDIDNFFEQLISDKPKQILQTLQLPEQGQPFLDLLKENEKNAKLSESETTLDEIKQLFLDLKIKDDKNNTNAKDQYGNNQISYILNELELSPTLKTILQDQAIIKALKQFITDNNKTPDQIKEDVVKLQSTDNQLIADALGKNGFDLKLDPAIIKSTIENISKENLAFEQHEKIINEVSQLKNLMQDATIQNDFLSALKTKTETDVDEFIINVKSNVNDINQIQQYLEDFKLAKQNDKKLATEIYAANQFGYLSRQASASPNLHNEFKTNEKDIKEKIVGNQQQAALSPKEIKDAFQTVKQAVDEKSIHDGLQTLGIKNPSANLLKENVDLFAKERMQAFARKQQLETRQKAISIKLNELKTEHNQKKPIADGGDKIAEQEIKDIEKQYQTLNTELKALPQQIVDEEKKLNKAKDEEDAFLLNKFINEQFTQPALAKAAADPSITVQGAQDKVEKALLESLHESKKGDRTNRYDTILLLAERYCLAAEKAALTNARHFNRSNDLTDTKKDLQENIAGCKRVKAELSWYVKKLESEQPQRKFAPERIQKSKKCIAELNASIETYEPAINHPLDKIVHFSSKSEVFTDMQERDKRISELLGASGQSAPLDQGSLTTDNNLASHFNTSKKFGNGARLNCLEENVRGKNINLLDNQQVVDGVFKTTAYFNLEDFKKCSRDQKLRYAIALIENHWAGDPSPHGKFKASANFPPELVELMAIYCKREHIQFVAPPQKPQSGLSKIFNQKPSEPTQKQVDDMDKKINENPTYFYGSEQLKTLTIRHETIKDMQQKTGQTDIQSYTNVRLGS